MARKKAEADTGVEVAEPTGTVQARRKAKREADKAAREVRAQVVKETRAAQKATADFLASKPTDSRKIADTRNVGG